MPSLRGRRSSSDAAAALADLTPAERRALDEELDVLRRRTRRRVVIALCVLAVPAYVAAALLISAHNR